MLFCFRFSFFFSFFWLSTCIAKGMTEGIGIKGRPKRLNEIWFIVYGIYLIMES